MQRLDQRNRPLCASANYSKEVTMNLKVSFLAVFAFTAMTLGTVTAASEMAWEEPSDPAMAINDPDRYAWRLFVALNWPADIMRKVADPSKSFGALGPVTWETWRNARSDAVETVFRTDGMDPGPWLGSQTGVSRSFKDFDVGLIQQKERQRQLAETAMANDQPVPFFDPITAERGRNETRLNKEAYEFVRNNGIYNIEGQIAFFDTKMRVISFPQKAKEIKAQWREIRDDAKPRFHWITVNDESGVSRTWGLTALHITTKDIPNWFWATFEHVDNRMSQEKGGWPDSKGWLTKSVDRFACHNLPPDCNKSPKGLGIEGTRWENYVLRGTQVDFIDSVGKPTLLANSQPERNFQETSSCITCHARASVGRDANRNVVRLEIFRPDGQSYFGSPDPIWFTDTSGFKFTQLDFVWSLMRACSSKMEKECR